MALLTYRRLPPHRGKWRVVDFLQRLGGLHADPPGWRTVTRSSLKFRLDTRSYIDRTVYYLGSYETRDTARAMRLLEPGMSVVDCGAHIGWFTLHAAKQVGPRGSVHAFEPSETTFERLQENIRLNGFHWVTANRMALGGAPGTVHLSDTGDAETTRVLTSEESDQEVQMTTLDDYLGDLDVGRVSFVKLDIEGAELPALKGARDLLECHRPVLMLELNRQTMSAFSYDPERVIEFLADHRYRVDLDGRSLDELRGGGEFAHFNVWAYPA